MGSPIIFLGRLTLVVINVILMIICLAIVTAAFLLKYHPSVFSSHFNSELDDVKEASKNVLNTEIETDNFDLGELYGPFVIVLIVVGLVILKASVLGFFGACCGNKKFLMMYVVLLSILVLGQITFIVLFFALNSTLKGYVRTPLRQMITSYHGLNGTTIDSLAWNFLMIKFQCCGIDDYEDFQNTDWFGGEHGNSANMLMPFACCVELPTTENYTCTEALDETLNNYDKGCLEKLWNELLKRNDAYSYIITILVLFLQILLIVFALLLYCKDDQKKTGPQEGRKKRKKNAQW